MRVHNPEKMALLIFLVALKGYQLKTENDLLIPCDGERELFVTDCADEALTFVREMPFRWQLSEEATDRT
ncbi:MAG: hypothetical protein HPY82_08390 [Gammaproteobacteria bacterium]|nr:hypothetical protein [Gammaproteobacteria bacterium]